MTTGSTTYKCALFSILIVSQVVYSKQPIRRSVRIRRGGGGGELLSKQLNYRDKVEDEVREA